MINSDDVESYRGRYCCGGVCAVLGLREWCTLMPVEMTRLRLGERI